MDNNDFILKIVAELEKNGIKTGYDKLKKELEKDPAKIDVILDTSGTLGRTKGSVKKLASELHNELVKELNKMKKAGQDVNIDLSVGDVEKVINNIITQTDKLEKEFDSATSKAQKFLAQFNNKSGGTLVNSTEFKAVQEAIDGLGKTHSIDDLNKAMNNLETTYNNMVSNLRNVGKSLNPFINAINDMKNMDSTLKGIELDFQSLASKPKTVADAIKDLHTQQSKVNQYSQGTVEWAQEYGILQSKIVAVKNEIQNVAKAEKASNTDESNKVKYYQRIIDNNKTIYSLKNKLLTADVRQTEEIDKQITKLEKRNQYNYGQLNKKGLTDNSWEQIVNGSKDALESQLRINSAKQEDIANTKAVAQAEKERIATLREQEVLQENVNKIQLSTDITKIENDYKRFGIVSQEVENNLKELKIARENALKAEGTDRASAEIEKYNQKLAETKSSWKELQATQVSVNQRTSQMTEMQEWMRKNQRATKLCGDQVQKLIQECQTCDKVRFDQIKNEFKELQVEAGKAGKLGNTLFGGIIEQGKKFIQWTGVTGAVMMVSNKVREAVDELKDLDDILTEINKTSDLTEQQLKKLGDSSFETASKYGKKASDYLTGVQEMYRAGFDNAPEMAELSILAQSAGDMEINSANDYLLATNAAYDFKGSVEELNKVLDSQNYITNNAAVSMQDMADATSEAASISAQYGVEINELSAMIATVASKTRETGSEVGTALRSIFVTLQDTASKPVVEAFDSVGISMTKFVDGTEQLKTPIELLKELSVAFNELPEGAIERSTILTDIGKKYHANTLSAILSDWESYEQMLELYSSSSADGSAFREAEKSANNLSGSLNKLSNTWTDTVNNILNSDTLTSGVNVLNDLLGLVNKLTESLGSLGTISLIGGGILGAKNAGICV